jgi:hypothetical protein
MIIVLDREKIQEDVLSEFIIALEHATGCHVKCKEIYELQTDNPKASSVLQIVFGDNYQPPVKKVKQVEKPKRNQTYYKILTGLHTEEEITGGALCHMLKSGRLELGTCLRHPIKGKFTVSKDINSGKYLLLPSPADLPSSNQNPLKSWQVFLPNSNEVSEQITIEEKNHRLLKGEFEPGTILHHPKAGRQLVTGPKGNGQGMKPVE